VAVGGRGWEEGAAADGLGVLRDTEGAQHGERAAGEAAASGRGAAPDVLNVKHLQRGAGGRGVAVGRIGARTRQRRVGAIGYGNGLVERLQTGLQRVAAILCTFSHSGQ